MPTQYSKALVCCLLLVPLSTAQTAHSVSLKQCAWGAYAMLTGAYAVYHEVVALDVPFLQTDDMLNAFPSCKPSHTLILKNTNLTVLRFILGLRIQVFALVWSIESIQACRNAKGTPQDACTAGNKWLDGAGSVALAMNTLTHMYDIVSLIKDEANYKGSDWKILGIAITAKKSYELARNAHTLHQKDKQLTATKNNMLAATKNATLTNASSV